MIDNNKCTLSDKELIEKAKDLVNKLAKTGGKSWSLRVPVDFNNDPDMIFIELCKRLEDVQQQVSIAVEKAKTTELQLKEAYNLGVYRGKCQILYPNSKDAFVTFDEYYKSIAPQILEELKGGEGGT